MIRPLVIKIGGIFLNNEYIIKNFFRELSLYSKSSQRNIIIVHSHGNINKFISKKFQNFQKNNSINTHSFKKLNIINDIDIMFLNYINMKLLIFSKIFHLKTLGISISDDNNILLNEYQKIIFDKKDIFQVVENKILWNASFLRILFSNQFIPIINSFGINSLGKLVYINSDILAMLLTLSLDAELIILTDVTSILDGKGQRIVTISNNEANDLINNGIITDGMINKVKSALLVSKILNRSVEISNWSCISNLQLLFNGCSQGTCVLYKYE